MKAEESTEGPPTAAEDRRHEPRLPVDEQASLLIVSRGSLLPGKIIEISLSGCRIILRDRFIFDKPVAVEASFKLRGVSFRMNGMAEWTDGKFLAGIRFQNVSTRRMDELVEVVAEMAEQAAKAVKQAAERLAAEQKAQTESAAKPLDPMARQPARMPDTAVVAQPLPLAKPAEPAPPKPTLQPPTPAMTTSGPLGPLTGHLLQSPKPAGLPDKPPAKPSARERRVQSRHQVDTSATILLVNVASRLPGRILNLSLGGCNIRTEDRFPVGIYTRVETEFHLEGLPFRLGGVVQGIQDRQHVGIRFLDMSERKREQLVQLIEEIEGLQREEESDESSASGAGGPSA